MSNNEDTRNIDSFTLLKKEELDKKTHKIKKKTYYYAVVEGYKPGIYYNWNDCQIQIKGFQNAIYKKFTKKEDAELFLNGDLTNDDFKLDESDISLLSINNKTIIENDKELNIFNIELFNTYENDFYIFTAGSYYKDKEFTDTVPYLKTKGNIKHKITENQYKMVSQFGIYFGNKSINISHKEYDSTNNQCELLGIKHTLHVLDKYKSSIKQYQGTNPNNKIYIISDSEYCIKALTEWIITWQKNNWKTKTYEQVKNKNLFISINLIMNKLKLHNINYEFKHINSHQQAPLSNKKEMFLWKGNQIAAYLAKNI
jgi:ribonuclease HI